MGITESDNAQDKMLTDHDGRIKRLEMDMNNVLQATSENAKAVTELRVTSANLAESSKALLANAHEHGDRIVGTESDVRWIRIIGGTLVGAIGTALVLIITGAIKF